jgi:hypothetical protein
MRILFCRHVDHMCLAGGIEMSEFAQLQSRNIVGVLQRSRGTRPTGALS